MSIQNLPKSLDRILNIAIETAKTSLVNPRHGAVIFSHSGRHIYASKPNAMGTRVCGYKVPSRHAEACVLHTVSNYMTHKGKGCREKGQCLQHGYNGN